MNTTDKSTQLLQMVWVIELRRTTTSTRVKRKAMRAMMVQSVPRSIDDRCNNRNFMLSQCQCELMFLNNFVVAPPMGSIEFGDDGRLILNTYLINTILIAI